VVRVVPLDRTAVSRVVHDEEVVSLRARVPTPSPDNIRFDSLGLLIVAGHPHFMSLAENRPGATAPSPSRRRLRALRRRGIEWLWGRIIGGEFIVPINTREEMPTDPCVFSAHSSGR